MAKLQNYLTIKFILVVFFFIGLSWLKLFLSPPTVSALRKTADEVYVQPITGLDKSGLFGPTQIEMTEAIINDNYQVYCAAPEQWVSAQISQKYMRYLELYFGSMKTHYITTTMTANDDIFNPLILDDTGEERTAVFKENKQSYVQYLNNSKTEADPLLQNMVSADYYKLLSLKDQCYFQKEAQKRVIYLCNKLQDTPLSQCPLNIKVPNINMEIAQIQIPNCETEITDPEFIADLSKSSTLMGLANLPFSQVYGKRPAFLVTCAEQKKSGGSVFENKYGVEDLALYMWTNWKNKLSSLFSGLTHELDQKKDECHVRTILIDAPTTEDEKINSIEAHNISRNIFTPLEDQIIIEEEYIKARNARREKALAELASGFSSDDRVNLVGSANEQTQVLTQIINGLAPAVCTPKNVRPETAPTITSEANFSEGGPTYKASQRTAADDFGLLDTLFALLDAEIETGERTKNDIENRNVKLETFLIAPYDDQATMDQWFSTVDQYQEVEELAASTWPSHVLFNEGIGEGQEYKLSTGSNKSSQSFLDPDDCKTIPAHKNSKGEWIKEEKDCWQSYGVGISNMQMDLGVDVIANKTRGNIRPMLSLLPYDSPTWNHVLKYSSSETANNEKLIKGSGDSGESDGGSGDDDEKNLDTICGVANTYNIDCDFFKAIYAVETCSGTIIPTSKDECCNSLGFCGPMQFAGGMTETVAPGENLKYCKEEKQGMDNFILAARWILIKKWCTSNASTCLSSPEPYKWKDSYIESQGNSNITTREEVEKFVIGWYGSTTQVETRVGWPAGSTYVDAVMEYLKTGSLWGGCGYQEP